MLRLTEFRDGGEILDRPSLVVDRALFSGEPIVRIQVKAAVAPPVRFRGVVYVRPGPTTRKAHPDDERLLAERRRANDLPFEMRPKYFTTRADLDMRLFVGTYLPAAVAPEVIPEVIAENGKPVDQQLASLHLTDAEVTPTVLGLLVIGYEPRTAIPGGYVQFLRYAGIDRAAAIADDHEIRGNVISVETQLDPVLRGNLRTGIVPQGILKDVPRPEYPWSAIREAVMNAIMHRDYEISNAPIRIDWFDDRIEISNPGGPYGRVRKDNFDHKEAMEQNGNPPPEFAVDDAYWSVALRGLS